MSADAARCLSVCRLVWKVGQTFAFSPRTFDSAVCAFNEEAALKFSNGIDHLHSFLLSRPCQIDAAQCKTMHLSPSEYSTIACTSCTLLKLSCKCLTNGAKMAEILSNHCHSGCQKIFISVPQNSSQPSFVAALLRPTVFLTGRSDFFVLRGTSIVAFGNLLAL